MKPGSWIRAAEVAANEVLKRGATLLQTKVAGFIASFGHKCWVTDRAASEMLRRWDGRKYHPGSIARARYQLRKKGAIGWTRIFPTKHLPNGKRSSQGTTSKWIDYKALNIKSPLTQAERREAQKLNATVERATTTSSSKSRSAFALVQRSAASNTNVTVPAELVAMLAQVAALPTKSSHLASRSTWQRSTPTPTSFSGETGRAGPDRESPEDAKRRLAAWERDNQKRGPP